MTHDRENPRYQRHPQTSDVHESSRQVAGVAFFEVFLATAWVLRSSQVMYKQIESWGWRRKDCGGQRIDVQRGSVSRLGHPTKYDWYMNEHLGNLALENLPFVDDFITCLPIWIGDFQLRAEVTRRYQLPDIQHGNEDIKMMLPELGDTLCPSPFCACEHVLSPNSGNQAGPLGHPKNFMV